jgi:retron-type reverse transcriptase
LEHRIADPRIIRLIQKWLRAGILEDGVLTVSDTGTGQGSVISPLLANVYLHYGFDLWAERWRRREATGDMIIVRYADDIVVGVRRLWHFRLAPAGSESAPLARMSWNIVSAHSLPVYTTSPI